MKRILITWYNSLDKANMFCEWVTKHYEQRKATIEKDNGIHCYWIYLEVREEDATTLLIVALVQAAIEQYPILSKH